MSPRRSQRRWHRVRRTPRWQIGAITFRGSLQDAWEHAGLYDALDGRNVYICAVTWPQRRDGLATEPWYEIEGVDPGHQSWSRDVLVWAARFWAQQEGIPQPGGSTTT